MIGRPIYPPVDALTESPFEVGRPWSAGGSPLDLPNRLLATFASGGWSVPCLFLARASDVTLVSTKVSAWTNHGTGSNATQGTDANRPTWNASGLNSKPALDFTATHILSTGTLTLSSFESMALLIVMEDSDSTAKVPLETGPTAGSTQGTMAIATNISSAGNLDCYNNATGAGLSRAQVGSTPLTTASMVTGTADRTLSTNETEIRVDNANVTATRPANVNSTTTTFADEELNIGARTGPSVGMTGSVAAVAVVGKAGGLDAAALSAISAAEVILMAEWGIS